MIKSELMERNDWQQAYAREINRAKAARSTGNEGMARVCARRASGILIEEYFRRQGISSRSPSAYDRLRQLAAMPGNSAATQGAVEHLVLRVNDSYQLPPDVDLIKDVETLFIDLLAL